MYIHMCISAYRKIYMYSYIYIHSCISLCAFEVHASMFSSLQFGNHIYMYRYIYIYLIINIYIQIYVYIYTDICICV